MNATPARATALVLLAFAALCLPTSTAFAQTMEASAAPSSDTLRRRVLVSLHTRTLSLVENGQVVRIFPVAVGAPETPSPVGLFTITNRIENPTYYRPGKVIPPRPSNPLGTRWLGLDVKGYGIHGTDNPASIGYAKSLGCIRLRNEDVEQLFELLRPGDIVELGDDPLTTYAKEIR